MLKQWIERSVVLWEMTMSREVLEILEKMDKKANGNYIGS